MRGVLVAEKEDIVLGRVHVRFPVAVHLEVAVLKLKEKKNMVSWYVPQLSKLVSVSSGSKLLVDAATSLRKGAELRVLINSHLADATTNLWEARSRYRSRCRKGAR